MYGSRVAGKSRLVMVLSYLESIEDPYQYGDDYGDLVEYVKMLLKGEEDYVPEEDGRIGSEKWLNDIRKNAVMREVKSERDFWEKHLKDSDFWKYPKFGGDGMGHAAKDQKGKKGKDYYFDLNPRSSPFNSPFDQELVDRVIKNSVEPKRNEQGVIIEDAFDTEDYLASWELNARRLDERIDKLTKELNDTREELDLVEEEHIHAKWKKMCEGKKLGKEVREAIRDIEASGLVSPEVPSIGEMVADMIRDDSSWKPLENSEEELLRQSFMILGGTEERKKTGE